MHREPSYWRDLSIQAAGALIGGFLAIVGALYLYTYQSNANREQEGIDTFLSMELELKANKATAEFVIADTETKVAKGDLWSSESGRNKEHQKIMALHDVAWKKVIEGGKSQHIDNKNQEALIDLHKHISVNNFLARKLEYGRYSNKEGKEYLHNLKQVLKLIIDAQDLMYNPNN